MLDMRSVVVSGVLVDIICTLVILVLWQQNRKRFDGLSLWAADFVLQTLGMALIVLRGAIPDWLSIIPSNGAVMAGALVGLWGMERFVGQRGRRAAHVAMLAAFFLVHVALTLTWPSIPLRSANIALTLMLFCGLSAHRLLRGTSAALRPVTRALGAVFASYTLLFALRIVHLLSRPDPAHDYFQSGSAESLFMLATQMHFILLTFAMILTVNRRLMLTIQFQEEKYSKAFHSAPYGMALTRFADGAIIEANDTFAQGAGCSQRELIGQTTLSLNLWDNPNDRRHVLALIASQGRVSNLEVALRKRTGERIVGLVSAEPIELNGERCLISTICDITARKLAEDERERLISEREKALSQVKTLSGLLPICASCKKIRDEKGSWQPIESYVHTHTQAEFSHGLCPECERTLYD